MLRCNLILLIIQVSVDVILFIVDSDKWRFFTDFVVVRVLIRRETPRVQTLLSLSVTGGTKT